MMPENQTAVTDLNQYNINPVSPTYSELYYEGYSENYNILDGNVNESQILNVNDEIYYYLNLTSSGSCPGGNITKWKHLPSGNIISPIFLSIMGVVGQVSALILLHQGGRSEAGRSVFYLILTMIIMADLIGQFTTAPFPIAMYIFGEWVGGWTTCYIHGYLMALIGLIQVFLVSIMSLERFMGISCTFYKREIFESKKNARKLVFGVVTFSILFCSLPFINVGEYVLQYPSSWCFLNIHVCSDLHWKHIFFTNMYASIFVFNIIIVVILNIYVVGSLLKMRISRPPTMPASHSENEIQMVIVLVVITLVFLISWAPLGLLLFLNQIFHTKNPQIDLVAIRLVSLNQLVDPWAYIICRKFFASKIWRWLKGTVSDHSANIHSIISNRRRSSATSNYSVQTKKNRSASTPSNKHNVLYLPNKSKSLDEEQKSDGSNPERKISVSEKTALIFPNQEILNPNNLTTANSKNTNQIPIPIFTTDQYCIQNNQNKKMQQENYLQSNCKSSPSTPFKAADSEFNSKQNNERSNSWSCMKEEKISIPKDIEK